MLDVLNEQLVARNEEPVVFDHDCREGICGACGMYINGRPHGPDSLITVCQLHMRKFKDGDTIVIEPWRARAFPVIKDLMVDRSAFDQLDPGRGLCFGQYGKCSRRQQHPREEEICRPGHGCSCLHRVWRLCSCL